MFSIIQVVNISSSVGCKVTVTTTQLCCCSVSTATDHTKTMGAAGSRAPGQLAGSGPGAVFGLPLVSVNL